jgi:hypothetical protein
MSQDRRDILDMLAQGKITADEAERLLTALDGTANTASADKSLSAKPKPKYLRVLVEADDHIRENPTRVNIRVPMQLLRAGIRLGTLIPAEAREKANAAMRERGVNFDLNQIKPENIEELIEQLDELTVDVDDDAAKVRVFCE